MGVAAKSDALYELVDRGAEVEQLGTGFTFTEGPIWNPDGFLLFSDMPGDTRRRWDEQNEEGMALLLIEQNLGIATSVADRQLVMVAGAIAAETTVNGLVSDPNAQRRYLGVEPLADVASE